MKTISTTLVLLLTLGITNAQTSSDDDSPDSTTTAAGQVQTVQVGQNGLVFEPSSITANPGDEVAFVIYTTHNVARSPFDNPCQPIGGSDEIWTGSSPEAGSVFTVTINDTNPVWLYCATGNHCQDGMAMVINPPEGDETLEAYQAAAADVSSSGSPTEIAGGVFDDSDDSDDSSSAESSSTEGGQTSSTAAETSTTGGSPTTTPAPTGTPATSTTAAPSTTPNAARNLFADMMMVGGAILAGSVVLM